MVTIPTAMSNTKNISTQKESYNNPCNYTVAAKLSDRSTLQSLVRYELNTYVIQYLLDAFVFIPQLNSSLDQIFSPKKSVSMRPAILDSSNSQMCTRKCRVFSVNTYI